MRLRSRGSQLLVGIWCLMCVVLANGYAGTLFSFMSVTKLEQPINSLDELANSKDVSLMMAGESSLTEKFLVYEKIIIIYVKLYIISCAKIFACQSALNGTDKLIGDSIRAHPENLFLVGSSPAVIKLLMTGTKAYTFVLIIKCLRWE